MGDPEEAPRKDGFFALKGSVDLAKVAAAAESLSPGSAVRDVCELLASDHSFVGPEQCSAFSQLLAFDSRRLCAAHNVAVASKFADSVRIATLCALLEGLVDSQDEVEALLLEMMAQPQSRLSGAMFDEVTGIIRVRPHAPRHRDWAESVLRSL